MLGDDITGPGAYPQFLMGPEFNSSDVHRVDAENETWTGYTVGGTVGPRQRIDPAIARGQGNEIVFFGGRTIE